MSIQSRDKPHLITDQYGRFRSTCLTSCTTPEVSTGDNGFLWVDIGVDGTPAAPVLKVWNEENQVWRTLGGGMTLVDHLAIGDTSPHHAAVTLAADADVLFGLSTQQLTLDSQAANVVLAGPSSGAAADPIFRALVAADLPSHDHTAAGQGGDYAWADITGFGTTAELADVDLAVESAGVSTLVARADHKHDFSEAIAPTWTGAHLFKKSADSVTGWQVQDQDGNVILNVDSVNNRVGVNNAAPEYSVDIVSPGSVPIMATNYSDTSSAGQVARRARGTEALPTQVLADDAIGAFSVRGYDSGGAFSAIGNAIMSMNAIENFTATAKGTYITFGVTKIGTTTRYERVRISEANTCVLGDEGAVLRLQRRDTVVLTNDLIGSLEWQSIDGELTTRFIPASIDVYSTTNITTDAPQAYMIFNVSGSTAAAAPIEHMRFAPTTVAKIGFFGAAPVVKPTALTAALTQITPPAFTGDYAIQAVTNSTPFGFVNANEGNTLINVVARLQTRVGELESKLQGLGLLT